MVWNPGSVEASRDEENVIALGNNLFGHDLFVKIPPERLRQAEDGRVTDIQKAYMDTRAIQAKRSVAQDSYSYIVGEKTTGTAGSREFLESMMRQLSGAGATNTAFVNDLVSSGSSTAVFIGISPSYHAQMEIMTKKIFQDPSFYLNLYDKKTNIDRIKVAVQAIGLMQKFDMFKSYLRQEMISSIMLENAIVELEELYVDEANQPTAATYGE